MAKKKHEAPAAELGAPVAQPSVNDIGAFGEGPVSVDAETARLAGLGAEYDATMTAVANGIEGAKGKKVKAPRDPNAVRAVFWVVGICKITHAPELLSSQKTLRRAQRWANEQIALIRRLYDQTVIFRAKEIR